ASTVWKRIPAAIGKMFLRECMGPPFLSLIESPIPRYTESSGRRAMKTYGKFALLVVAIIGILVWLAMGGISESKTYYKTISELNQLGDQAHGRRLLVGGDVQDGSIVRNG